MTYARNLLCRLGIRLPAIICLPAIAILAPGLAAADPGLGSMAGLLILGYLLALPIPISALILIAVRRRLVDESGKPIAGARILLGEGDANNVTITADGSEEMHTTDDKGHFELQCGGGPRVILFLGGGQPTPLLMKPFVAQNGQKHDLGTLTADPKSMGMGRAMQKEGGGNEGEQ